MLSREDQFCARVSIHDEVEFKYRRGRCKGIVTRTNPKRAIVQVEGDFYNVPYDQLIPDPQQGRERQVHIEHILYTAQDLMKQHGLTHWKFKFDHSTRRAGSCSYRDKTITLSFNLARRGSQADIRDTVLHEIAHALVGKRHNHDAVWKAKARAIGCSGDRTHRLDFSPPRWRVRCENDCWTHTAQRRNPQLVCRNCGGRLVFSDYL